MKQACRKLILCREAARFFSVGGRWLVIVGMVLGFARSGDAFSLSADQRLDGEAPRIVGEGDGNTVVPAGEAPDWIYRWGDRAGDGSGVAVADPGLNIGSFRLYSAHEAGTIVLDLNGGAIEGEGETAITTFRESGHNSASITLTNAGTVATGRIETRAEQSGNQNRTAGHIRIGGPDHRVGPVRVAGLDAHASGSRARPGSVQVYSSGPVRIEDGAGAPGDIRADTLAWSGGDVVVDHVGGLSVGSIRTSTEGHRSFNVSAGNIRLDGGDRSGDAVIGRLQGWDRRGGYSNDDKALFTIANYRNVTVGDIEGQADRATSTRFAADLRIREGITGDIVLTGNLNLGSSRANPAPRFRGTAELVCDGSITLAEVDLDQVQYLALKSGRTRTVVQGDLLNLDVARLDGCEGTGQPQAPFAADQDNLRTPEGHTVMYNSLEGRNAELGGHAYRLADLEGNPGQGGLLIHDPDLPVVHTAEATGIHTTEATLHGVLATPGATPATVAVLWGGGADFGTDPAEWPQRNEIETVQPDAKGQHTFEHRLGDLTPGATYAFRFFAHNEAGMVLGAPEMFTAWDAPETPSLTVGSVEWEEAELHVAFGGTPEPRAALLIQPGHDAGTGAPGDWARKIPLEATEGTTEISLDGLQRGGAYVARVHARNEVDEAWSEPVKFATLSANPEALLTAAGIRGGLCVHLGSGNGDMAAAIGAQGPFLVHGLDADEENIAQARRRIRQRGLYGPVSVEHWRTGRLPYADTMVNLLIVESYPEQAAAGLTAEEIWRVLTPRGVAMLKAADEAAVRTALPEATVQAVQVAGEPWVKAVKPWPAGMDDWRHPWYDPTRSATSQDTHVGPSRSLRWIDGPDRARTHMGRPHAVVSAGGRFFYMQDKAPPSFAVPANVYLVARDAFSGVVLWRRPVKPPSRPYRSPLPAGTLVAGKSRLYAVLEEDRVLHALDPATGESLQTYGTADHLVALDEDLVVIDRAMVRRIAKRSGDEVWAVEAGHSRQRNQLAVGRDRVFVRSERHGRIRCLALETGEQLWEYDHGHSFCGLVEDILILSTGSSILGVDVRDADVKWTQKVGTGGRGNRKNVFIADGLVWAVRGTASGMRSVDWVGFDPMTGELKRTFSAGFTDKCAPGRATDQYLITGRNDYFSVRTGERTSPHIARGVCGYPGVIPANGLVYTFPTDCICYVMLFANVAMSPVPVERDADPARALERGPAAPASEAQANQAGDWPMFRGNARRSGALATDVAPGVQPVWTAVVAAGQGLSAPVSVGSRVFVSVPDAQEVHALDAETGRSLWVFTAGGRVLHPPTITHGVCMFGSEDGFVYALNPEDGRLIWRYRVAPGTGRIFAYGRLSSAWPVLGSVLADGDRVLAVAGRHGPLDGGARAVALDPRSGALLWSAELDGANHVDLLVKGDQDVFMWNDRFNVETGAYRPGRGRRPHGRPALFSGATLMNTSWATRSRWNMGNVHASLLVFNEQGVFGIDPFRGSSDKRATRQPSRDHYQLLFRPTGEGESWDRPLPSQLRALVLAGQTLFAAGPPDVWPTQGGKLYAVNAANGDVLMTTELDMTPLQDGLIAANGRLFMSTEEGLLIGFAAMH